MARCRETGKISSTLPRASGLHTSGGKEAARNRIQEAQDRGIWHVGARHGLEIDAQIFELAKLIPTDIDPRCRMPYLDHTGKKRCNDPEY